MAILQIFYLIINIIGVIVSLVWLSSSEDFPIISSLFNFIGSHLGNVVLALSSILLIALFIPAITFIAIMITFTMLFNAYSK